MAITLLNANVNPAHERLRDRLLAALPGLPVSISSEVSPEIREYERSSTTVLNALLIPVVRSYLVRLAARLAARGITARLLLVQSNGGVCSAEVAGDAAGAAAAVRPQRRGAGGAARRRPAGPARPGRDRHGRHQLRRVRGAGRRGGADDAGRDRRPAGAPADGGDPHDRRGRRLDRGRAARRAAGCGAAQRRRPPGPGLLRPGRHAADGHRRQPGAGPAGCRLLPGRRAGPGPARRARGHRGAGRRAAGPRRWKRRRKGC